MLISTTTLYMARSSVKKKKSGSILCALNTDKDIKKSAYTKFYFPNRNTGISK